MANIAVLNGSRGTEEKVEIMFVKSNYKQHDLKPVAQALWT